VETSFLTFSMILEEISRVCASSALLLIAQADGTLPLVHGGSEDLKAKYLNRLGGDSRVLTALAATEPGAGSDVLSMRTTAVLKGDRYIINGQKCFITNGSVADFFVLYAYWIKRRKPEALARSSLRKTSQDFITARTRTRWGCGVP
jgi:alkylation response protein AidB-like acyl-CoA dehydrogenase